MKSKKSGRLHDDLQIGNAPPVLLWSLLFPGVTWLPILSSPIERIFSEFKENKNFRRVAMENQEDKKNNSFTFIIIIIGIIFIIFVSVCLFGIRIFVWPTF